MQFTLNGNLVNVQGNPELSLLKYLRDEQGLISLKDGCSGQAGCGCCTVQMDDRAVLSCVTSMKKVEGKTVTTIEGLDRRLQDIIGNAFVLKGGVQCGFCTPGIVMRIKVFLEHNPEPSREEIKKALQAHICRCTGYKKIIDAVELIASCLQDGTVPTLSADGRIGASHPKYQAKLAALGQREFVCDIKVPEMLFGALKFSDHPRARINSIDVANAAALTGVHRVFLKEDVPGDPVIGLIVQDWPAFIGMGEVSFYTGSVIAGVVADTDDIARAAVDLIEVKYEVLPPVTDVGKALGEDSPRVHENGNLLSVSHLVNGDVVKALAGSKYKVKRSFHSQRIDHGFMEVECCLAEPWTYEGQEGVKVYSQTQGAYEDRKQIAKLLGLAPARVNVVQVQNGGGFGGKEDMTVQGYASLFAWHLKKPVRVQFTRGESIRVHPKRHPFDMEYELGCDERGMFTGLKAVMVGDTGAHASVGMKVLERACGHATGAYIVPHVDLKATAVYTNNVPCGAMRGFGVNQAAFAMESCIDELCEMGGFDRWQIRWDNAIRDGVETSMGEIIKEGAGVRACLEAVKEAFTGARYAGLACGIKNSGIGNGMPDVGRAKIVVAAEDAVEIHHGWTEMGQGVHTVALQTVVEETGLPADMISVRVETHEDTECGMTTSSRGTVLVGNSLIDACRKFKEDLRQSGLKELVGQTYRGEWICDWTTELGDLHPDGKEVALHYSYGYAAQVVVLDDAGKIEKIVAAHDAGKIMNPIMFAGQVEGAVHMGLGYALTEDFPVVDGVPVHTKLKQLGILRAKEMPDVDVIGVEKTDPHGPYGAKGVGEIGLVPTAAAVINALYQYDKKRRTGLPLHDKSCLPGTGK